MDEKIVQIKIPIELFNKIRLYTAGVGRTRNEILLEILEKYFKEINPEIKY